MKKFHVFAMLLSAVVTVGILQNCSVGADTDETFGQKIAGSYLIEFSEPTGDGTALVGQTVATFGADGTYLAEETIAF
jgi:hypothetical protein